MCLDPVTLGLIAAGASAAGTVAGGVAQNRAARAQSTLLEQQAQQTREAAAAEADIIRRQAVRTRSAARASLAASGVDVGDGSAVVIDQDINDRASADVFNVLLSGGRRASMDVAQAGIGRAAGRGALTGSLLAGAGQVGGSLVRASRLRTPSSGSTGGYDLID